MNDNNKLIDNKILNFDWFSMHLFVTFLTADHVIVLQVSNLNNFKS